MPRRPPSRQRSVAVLAPLLLAACAPGGTPVPSANTAAPAAANVADPPPAPPPPVAVRVASAQALAAGGAVPLAAGGESTVDPASAFRVELPATVPDARLTLIDQGDALVPGKGERSVGQATVLTFQPDAPLAPGGRYRLRLDGVATRELHPAEGPVALPVDWLLTVAGEPPADKGKAGAKKRRK